MADDILSVVGATVPVRDNVDMWVLKDFANGTGSYLDNVTYPDDFPTFNSPAPSADADDDGMPDAWETSNGLDPTVDDSAQDLNNNGYTNIEEYLYALTQ